MATTIEYCKAALVLYKRHAVYTDADGKRHTIPQHLMAKATLKAKRVGGIVVSTAFSA